MISDVADGNNCISGQKEVFSHFFTQGHWTKSVQITEHHLSLCPGTHTHTHRTKYRFYSSNWSCDYTKRSKNISALHYPECSMLALPALGYRPDNTCRRMGEEKHIRFNRLWMLVMLDEERQQCGWTADRLFTLPLCHCFFFFFF